MATFLSCASCGCAARSFETACPGCLAPLRRATGSIPRSAAAIALGLSTLASAGGSGCGAKAVFVVDDGDDGANGGSSSSADGGASGTNSVTSGDFTTSGFGGFPAQGGFSAQGGGTTTGEGGSHPVYGVVGTGGSGGEPL